ncbi:Type I R-M system specificity subunit [Helicobacter pylori Cuz20]|uniref:Type I R-M system specificity subunit n=1 Tax=Helicobacter pylori (strain Cuz20) TaxID=765964 RepID=A0AB32X8S1_HELPC|nr:restriction endonuclease subunit S [Helicobacter pylori]ADO04058.1 Type I R-M system specificity subunit [Helicobacter pylori Cuz20]
MHKIERLLQTLAPKGVEFRKLGDIGEYIRGVTYKKNQEINNLECGIKVLRANNITLSNHLNFEDIKVINKNVKIRKEQYLKKNDILICAGSGSSEHIGKVAFINTDFDYVFGGFMGVIRIREVNSRFVYHIFTSNIFKQYLEKSLNTTTINNLNANILQNFLIPIPPLEIQQEIVKILDAFTELNTELNTELKARKKQYQYYQNMLLDFKDIHSNHKDAKMSAKTYPKRLKTLLQTLAPKGVEFRKLGEVLEYDQPNKYCVTSKEFDKSYPTPVLTAGKTFILGYTNEKDNIYQASKSSPVIIFDDFTTATQWVDFPFKVKSSAMKILLPKNPTINIRFIFFYMQTIPYNISGEHTRQWISRYSQITIPIPPLEIQQEIVKILDQFLALTTDLLAGIPAEIEARKKQYEYYREKLLTFKPLQNKA